MATSAVISTPYASPSLYVGDITPDVTEALLFELFNAVGPVASVRVCRDAATRRSLGYAYVNFHRVDDAERALDTMNFKQIGEKPCRIMWSHRDPALRKSSIGNVFIKGLAPAIDSKTLYDTFSVFGNILSCKVATNTKRESLGYGFVHYETEEAAQNAIARVDGKVIAGGKVSVCAFKSKKERGGANKTKFTNLFVKNLPADVSKEDLDAQFGKYGTITSSMVAFDQDQKNKGFGFVNFAAPEEAAAALDALNNVEWNGKKLYIARAQKKDEREKELRDRFEQLKVERQKKYAGINVYIKNLSDEVDDDRLRQEFEPFGTITSCRVMRDQEKSRGFGFVCFSTPEEATKAVTEMNGRMVDGKPLYVALAQRKEVRRAQLEAQHAARAKLGMQAPPMGFPPQGAPMFYQGMPQRAMLFPAQPMMRGGWGPQGQPRQVMGGMRPVPGGYQQGAMPMNQGQRQQGGGRGGRGGRRQGGGGRGQGGQHQAQTGQSNVAQATGPAAPMTQPLTITALADAPEEMKKQMIGEHLFPLISAVEPELAGKITGMLLEMDNGELIHLLESRQALNEKISEAIEVLRSHPADEGEGAQA